MPNAWRIVHWGTKSQKACAEPTDLREFCGGCGGGGEPVIGPAPVIPKVLRSGQYHGCGACLARFSPHCCVVRLVQSYIRIRDSVCLARQLNGLTNPRGAAGREAQARDLGLVCSWENIAVLIQWSPNKIHMRTRHHINICIRTEKESIDLNEAHKKLLDILKTRSQAYLLLAGPYFLFWFLLFLDTHIEQSPQGSGRGCRRGAFIAYIARSPPSVAWLVLCLECCWLGIQTCTWTVQLASWCCWSGV